MEEGEQRRGDGVDGEATTSCRERAARKVSLALGSSITIRGWYHCRMFQERPCNRLTPDKCYHLEMGTLDPKNTKQVCIKRARVPWGKPSTSRMA